MSEYIIECDYDFDEGWIPDEQREEIVRCCDCKYYELVPEDSGDWCGYWTDRIYADVRGSGFCAWGEREDGDAR